MPTRKTSTSKSLDNFLSNSDGKKVTKSSGIPRKTAQSESKKQTPKKTTTTPKAKEKSLTKNSGKSITTRAKVKSVKTSTKSTTSTSKAQTKKPSKTISTPPKRTVRGTTKKTTSDFIKKNLRTKPVPKKPVAQKPKTRKISQNPESFCWTKSRTKKLFPWVETFPVSLDDNRENKKCWFVCLEHAEKYVVRYKMYKDEYKCIVYYKSDAAK